MSNPEIEQAFKKLLSFVYYDKSSTMLHLRSRMATRIAAGERDEIITNVSDIINGSGNIEEFLKRIDTKLVPKGVETNHENENILTNYRKEEKNNLSGINLMFDGPVELFVLSVYWLMKYGYKLDKQLGDHCYGNRLWTEKNGDTIKNGRALLKPYINQYQEWRDKAINAAKTQLEEGIDVGFVNLDITKFYYNIRLDWNDIEKELKVDKRSPIHKSIYSIYKHYSLLIESEYSKIFDINKETFSEENKITLLPIGLPSSYILANYHLLSFDHDVIDKIKPIYYGRYVDDILIVIRKPTIKKTVDTNFFREIFNIPEKSLPEVLGWNIPKSTRFIYHNLHAIFKIKYKGKNKGSEVSKSQLYEFVFKTKGLDDLFIQNKKVMIYEFKSDYSLSVIEKLKKDLEERSSEFRFLPTTEDADFDKSAFHLLFDDSVGKPRTLKDYKENRFGIASYLFKRTAVALWSSKSEVSDEAKKILSFFKGSNIIRFYQQWERLFTYFVVANRKNELNDLIDEIFTEIEKVQFAEDSKELNRKLKQNLAEILCTSLSQALALNPSFLRNEWAITRLENSYHRSEVVEFPFGLLSKIESLTNSIRKSHLLRHFYLQHPLIEYSPFSSSEDISSLLPLIGSPFNYDSTSTEDYKLTDDLIKKIDFPRFIKFYEICIYLWRLRIIEAKEEFDNEGHNKTNIFEANDFLDEAWRIYSLINFDSENAGKDSRGRDRKNVFFKTHCKKIRTLENSTDPDHDSCIHEIHVNNENGNDYGKKDINLALANIKVDWNKEAVNAIKNRPNRISINRQQRFARLINKLSEEQEWEPDLFLLPEISVPHELVLYFSFYSVKHQIAMLLGTEHVRAGGLGINFIHSILPVEVNNEMYDAIFLPRLKNHYSHEEVIEINGHQLEPLLPENFHYHLIKFRNSYYTTFYCFELSDIEHRGWFRSKIDFLAAPEFNHDVNYFSNIVESSARDLNTFVVQVNTSDYGDTRLTQPTKTEQKDLVRIKGGENDVVVIGKIKIDEFRKFQELGYHLQSKTKVYKPSPPNFNVSYVHKRINGDWIFDDECED